MKTEKSKLIGRRLRFFREREGFSQLNLEVELQMSSGALSKIENGSVNPTKETLYAISEVLNMSLREQTYAFGFRMYPVDTKAILRAKQAISKHYKNPFIFSYFIDDRYRI